MFGISWIEVTPEQRGLLTIQHLKDRFIVCETEKQALTFIAEHPHFPAIRLWENIPIQISINVKEIKRGAGAGESMVSKSDEPVAE